MVDKKMRASELVRKHIEESDLGIPRDSIETIFTITPSHQPVFPI